MDINDNSWVKMWNSVSLGDEDDGDGSRTWHNYLKNSENFRAATFRGTRNVVPFPNFCESSEICKAINMRNGLNYPGFPKALFLNILVPQSLDTPIYPQSQYICLEFKIRLEPFSSNTWRPALKRLF